METGPPLRTFFFPSCLECGSFAFISAKTYLWLMNNYGSVVRLSFVSRLLCLSVRLTLLISACLYLHVCFCVCHTHSFIPFFSDIILIFDCLFISRSIPQSKYIRPSSWLCLSVSLLACLPV